MATGFFTAGVFLAALCQEMPKQCKQDTARMANIAVAAERAQTQLAPKWRRSGKLMSGAILTAIINESGGWRSVHDGTRQGPTGDICLMQIHSGNPTWKRYGYSVTREALAGTDVEATTRCILTGLHTLINSYNHCHRQRYYKHWAEAMWSVYGSGNHCWKTKSRFKRANLTKRIAWTKYTPTAEHAQLVMESRLSIEQPRNDDTMSEANLAYPLQWPTGWKRIPRHKRAQSRHQVTFAKARDALVKELRLFGAKNITVSTDIPLRKDGLPYANMREPDDPGVAVYWQHRNGTAQVLACDAWRTVLDNMRALHASIAVFRTIDRAKAGEVLDRAFQGFKALPAAGETSQLPIETDWREPLGLLSMQVAEINKATLNAAYRQKARTAHPDHGGRVAEWNRLRVAYHAGKAAIGDS